MGEIDTDSVSNRLRAKAINLDEKKILISILGGSEQEKDLTSGANCSGYGRIRHFRRKTSAGWPSNPLPIDPACHKLGITAPDVMEAQVFQNAACNWRCWYCFVPFGLLAASPKKAAWFSAAELVDLFTQNIPLPHVIDLSGGQPDLTPEWIPWMMKELRRRELDKSVYLWSDDNLSNDYMQRFLSKADLQLMRGYSNYGKACCFKGFDSESFAFNTGAAPVLFERQFELFRSHLALGLDLYAYATFTSPNDKTLSKAMPEFVDRLQEIHPNLPLRTVPLQVTKYGPMQRRIKQAHENSIRNQEAAIQQWNVEIEKRFSQDERGRPIHQVPLGHN
jgi:uncharacterized Fe-S cluster-containing radical SAM superfamily protein